MQDAKQHAICWKKSWLQLLLFVLGLVLSVTLLLVRLNLLILVNMIFCGIAAIVLALYLLMKKRLSGWVLTAYAAVLSSVLLYAIFFGADAGFGGFMPGYAGFLSAENPLLTGEGSLLTRLAGNLLLALPSILIVAGLLLSCRLLRKKETMQRILTCLLSCLLVLTTAGFILTMNLRSKPNVDRLWEGHDDYLKKIDKNRNAQSAPNVLFVMVDDLGYGDVSAHGALYETPNIDTLAQEGVSFENFYSSYSVCSPARFATLTGRYPYRGFADNVLFPSVNTFSPFAATRMYNSASMGGNVDGMLGDEVTLAETLQSAGYATGLFGKWHLGDYGEYLPTNQGFDYFYGSHHVNDMTPFYHVREEAGEYEVVRSIEQMRDQSRASEWIHAEIDSWVRDVVGKGEQPFFAYYASPWPHAPLFVGEDFRGKTGLGDYADCVVEFDHYLGLLLNTLEELGVLDDTIIMFTSDNGPALQGSTGGLRGAKYMMYDGGQKVPFFMRWGNSDLLKAGSVYQASATLVDIYPTLVQLCGVTGEGGTQPNFLPQDRTIDGASMLPILQNDTPIHTVENPVLHMKQEKLRAIQYAIPTTELRAQSEYAGYPYDVLHQNEYVSFKYLENEQNDNPAFFDKRRRNWLHIITDDAGENYNRAQVYPTVADEMQQRLDEIMKDFKANRRGIS